MRWWVAALAFGLSVLAACNNGGKPAPPVAEGSAPPGGRDPTILMTAPPRLPKPSQLMAHHLKVETRRGDRTRTVPNPPASAPEGGSPPSTSARESVPVTPASGAGSGFDVVPVAATEHAGAPTTTVQGACPTAATTATASTTSTVVPSPEAIVQEHVTSYFNSVNSDTCQATAVAVAVVEPDPEAPGTPIISEYYFGWNGVGNSSPIGEESRFELGSQTKVLVATALAQLVLDGTVALDTPAQTYLSQAGDSVTVPTTVVDENVEQISVLDLATHTAGLSDDPDNLTWKAMNSQCVFNNIALNPSELRACYSRELLWAAFNGYALQFTPGTQWSYSDWGFAVLGTLLADLKFGSNNAVPDAAGLVGLVTGPLNLSDTTLEEIPANSDMVDPTCPGAPPCYWNNVNAFAGGGGLTSTLPDMAKWAAANVGYNAGALEKAIGMATSPQRTGVPIFPAKGATMDMGLGWQIYHQPSYYQCPRSPVLVKDGGTSGFHGITYLVPEAGWALSVLANGVAKVPITDISSNLVQDLKPPCPPASTTTSSPG